MDVDYQALRAECPDNLRESITLYFRKNILAGRFAVGEKLPSLRRIAEELGTSNPNVHAALFPLVREGLIAGDRRTGNVVSGTNRRLTRAAIYLMHETIDNLTPYLQTFITALSTELEARRIAPQLVIDNACGDGMRQLKKLTAAGEIQGVLYPGSLQRTGFGPRLKKLPLPVVDLDGRCNHLVSAPRNPVPGLAVEQLHRVGARRLGVICTIHRYEQHDSGKVVESPFYRNFRQRARQLKAQCRDEWLYAPPPEVSYIPSDEAMTEFAMRGLAHFVQLPPERRPDGLFIFPDQLITGVMMGVLHYRIPVPEKLKLAVYRNWEIPATLLVDCEQVGVGIREAARNLIENLFRRLDGREALPFEQSPTVQSFRAATGRAFW